MPTALITGASRGIGKAIAIELAKKNYDLLLVARSERLLNETSAEINQQCGSKIKHLAIDLASPNAAQQVLAWVESEKETVSVLVNNAGYGLSGAFESESIANNRDMMQLNMVSLVELCAVFLPMLKGQPQAYILNIASSTAYQALPLMSLYAASKVFVLNFSRGIRHELRKSRVSVTVVCPGATTTDFNDRANIGAAARKAAEKVTMLPQDVAQQAVKAMFARKAEVITGVVNKFGAFAAWLLPKALIEKIASDIYEGK